MTLTPNDKLNLVKDILTTHHSDGVANASEYEQLHRIVQNLLKDSSTTPQANTLQAINAYCSKGLELTDYNDHLTENKDNINTWIQSLG
ncbi:hypothetical protein GCM10011391_37740 [Pullulanibacillus camelliae]|uniref:YtzH-like protein n=1 Tax=Pullulanibacillus camelliae TaxID=1707096 RepID=A0A8J2YN38_9BACL|nr:YtzH-like family protein [Pullulanibacillus camelliae]GGE55184.1 hypothetical protein GCM10011391_37740 [Pullulanibacillus camelliae]